MTQLEDKQYAIVADIGGTFARFSRVNLDNLYLDKIEIYSCAEVISFEAALLTYQAQHSLHEIKYIAIAIACPVIGDLVCMTNSHWRFSIQEVQSNLSLSKLKVMNDFTAIAMSLPVLRHHELTQIGKGHIDANKPRVVLGAGTGLGVAYLVPNPHGYKSYSGEGGHASWGAQTEQEWFIYSYLKKNYTHVSYERLLSGQGLENLYQAIAAYHQQTVASLSAAQIIALALKQECTIAKATIEQFFATMGVYAGDLALTFGALGGVYIAGGIAPRLLSFIPHTDFRIRFEDKGRFSDFNSLIPTYIITAEQPGMIGASVCLKQSLQGVSDVVY
ncbi:glucokinase [Legionella fallonii]|uniref:Glucokinase n=1 Tax=Legionella fallonii LLAP-10 TaxID=1212491 RepID=A0A098G9C1_9GAMM|nr:glucokinase [Legionella fallonii]CEG58060.1 Glucokinase [Legionella fallonii LLAP-10]